MPEKIASASHAAQTVSVLISVPEFHSKLWLVKVKWLEIREICCKCPDLLEMFDSDNNSPSEHPYLDHGKRKSSNSINGYTRAVRRKLYFLFAMLVVVIILMKEARKPERWLWMGFESHSASSSPFELAADRQAEGDSSIPGNQMAAGLLPAVKQESVANGRNDILQRMSFLRELWDNLELEDQTGLVQLIQASQQPLNDRTIDPADFEILAEAIRNSKPAPGGTFSTQWNMTIAPGLISIAQGSDITVGQQNEIGGIFEFLDPLILDELDDFTSPGMKSDLPAWHRFWGLILDESVTPAAQPVTPVQLVAQPDVWRFNPVRLKGRLVSGRSRKAKQYGPLYKQEQWYEWWIGNPHGSDELWCVYTATKPDSIEVSDRFADFDINIEVDGYFYKIRSYVDAQSKANHCPLILAKSLSVNRVVNPVAAASWKPSASVLVGSIAGVMVLALAVATMIYRSDHIGRRHPGGKHQESIESHLQLLEENGDIKSTIEKLEELQ